ncbi:MAG: hypothetical protein ACFCVD_23800 [Nodosilinea sp.]
MEDKTQNFFNNPLVRALGFIADIIAISSINISLKANGSENLPGFINPGSAFVIWILAFYTYICFLNNYWKKHRESKGYSYSFSLFLLEDLLLEFSEPILFFPAIISIITLLWITITADRIYDGSVWTFSLCIALVLGCLRLIPDLTSWRDEKINPKIAKQIDQSWPLLENQIYSLLPKKGMQLNKNDIEFVLRANGLPVRESVFDYIFRRISSEDEELAYGMILDSEGKIVIYENILIKQSSLPDGFRCESINF